MISRVGLLASSVFVWNALTISSAYAQAAPAGAQPGMENRSAASATPPKLIVAISVDQFSENLYAAWRGKFTGGLARLSQGIVYSNAYQSHAHTETCPGHSTLLSGRHPNKTGLVGNTMRDPNTGKDTDCLYDPDVVLAHDAKATPSGPKNLMADTLGDWLKSASSSNRIFSVSGKDRGAITMAGHHADGVFWLAPGYGFTTYIRPGANPTDALAPLARYNTEIAGIWKKPAQWSYSHDDCRALAATWTVDGESFISKLPPVGYGQSGDPAAIAQDVMTSPAQDNLTLGAALSLIKEFKLGEGPAIDVLTISFSATDFIGHRYGTRGPEMCEQLWNLDTAIGTLLKSLDATGVSYVVALSADHGGSDFVERLKAQGFDAERIDVLGELERINVALMAKFGLSARPLEGTLRRAFLTSAVAMKDRPRVLAAAKHMISSLPEVVAVFELSELLDTPIPSNASPEELTLKERFAESAYPGRSGDLLTALKPYSAGPVRIKGNRADHGSVWDYDRRVPMLFWWNGAPSEDRFLPTETVDIAPTLARVLGLRPPSDVDGHCLPLTGLNDLVCAGERSDGARRFTTDHAIAQPIGRAK